MADPDPLAEYLQHKANDFMQLCQDLQDGKTGEEVFGFLEQDVIHLMMEELARTANLCREQFIKLAVLQDQLEDKLNTLGLADEQGDLQIGWPKKKDQS